VTEATVPAARGWNTWDVQYHTGWVHLPSGLRLRFALRSPDGALCDGFTWRHGLVRLGHHTVDGRYAEVTVRARDTELWLRAGGGGDSLDVLASTSGGDDEPVLIVDGMPGVGDVEVTIWERSGRLTVCRGDDTWWLDCVPAAVPVDGDPRRLRFPGARSGGDPLAIAVRPATDPVSASPATAPEATGRVEDSAASAVRLCTDGWLGTAGDAMTRALTWNTIYVPQLHRVLTPTSRDFVCREREGFYGRWALHTWDTFFTGLVAGWVDPAYAEGIFGQILDWAGPDGMLPNRVSDDRGRTDDRSQPPVGGYTVLKAYLGSGLSDQTRRRGLLERSYPALLAWHRWWAAARLGPHGLLAWGSDPVAGDAESATIDRAKRESGLDDSPMYDDAVLDPLTHTMNLADVGLNALFLADAEALSRIARVLGDGPAEATLAGDAARLAGRWDALWDAGRGRYGNRWADGHFSGHTSPTLLYPLLTGLPDTARARAVADALLDPAVLGGDPPLPSTARDDPGFSARYWRGRVWAPMAFLAIEGLRRHGLVEHSRPLVDALLRLFLREWTEHSHVRENYPVVPGEDVRPLAARSDGLMGWGGLLGYLAIQELADPRPEGWRFADPGRPATVENLALAEGSLGVRAGERLVVMLDGRPLLDLPPGSTVTRFERTRDEVRGVLHPAATATPGAGPLVAAPSGAAGRPVTVRVAGVATTSRADGRALIGLAVPDGQPVEFSVQAQR
jgi:putative isomerase